jgi:hypothetical protein
MMLPAIVAGTEAHIRGQAAIEEGLRMKKSLFCSVFLFAGLLFASAAGSQSFSCPIGKQASCLDYGDKVCDSFAKCVAGDAVVFPQGTCDYNGFVCKSSLNGAVDEYEALRRKFNQLVDDSNTLRNSARELNTALTSAKEESSRYQSELNTLKSCIDNAASIEEAKACE